MTANGDLLRQLFRGYVKKDDVVFRASAEAIIQEERAKNHRLLADDLEKILLSGNGNGTRSIGTRNSNFFDIPKDKERGFPLLDVANFKYDWDRLVLPEQTLEALKEIVKEHYKKDLLAAGGLKPKQKVIFYGPPGCGKTLAAQVMSAVLGYPLVTVRFDAIVSSFLGETAANLRRVFEFIQNGQWVVLFDEFDAIGKDRNNPFEHGELKRVVNTLLQLMDAFKGESLLIAATNHEGLLDSAIWRRFEAIVAFNLPKQQDRILLFRNFLAGYNTAQLNLTNIARNMKGATGADIELVSVDAARRALLDNRTEIIREDIENALTLFRERLSIVQGSTEMSNKHLNLKEDIEID